MIYISLFIISASILALQILQTRIFSFTLWHHLAYMVITVALMGMGAAGSYLAVRKKRAEEPEKRLTVSLLLFSVSTFFSLAIVTRIPLDTFMADKVLQLGYIFLYYMALIFPYFFAGIVISLTFVYYKRSINLIYLTNLIGSAIGGVLIIPVMERLGGEGAVFTVIAAGFVAATLTALTTSSRLLKTVSPVLLVALLFAYPYRLAVFPVVSPPSKAMGMAKALDPNQTLVYTSWDRVARIDVVDNKRSQEMFNYFPKIKNKIITIDGDAYTLLYNFPSVISLPGDGATNDLYYTGYPPLGEALYSSAYLIHDKPKVLVVGLGGGTDIITALYHQAVSVKGVEINAAMLEVTRDKFARYIGRPYQNKKVSLVHSEGRSYLRRDKDHYDIIQMSGVDTWTALSTGAYVMSESYIYTTNALDEYLNRLTPDGTLSIIRWIFWPPREMLRLCSEAVVALRAMGVKHPEKNIVVIGDGNLASILIKRRAFTFTELATLLEKTRKTKHNRIIYAPGFEGAETPYYLPLFKPSKILPSEGVHYIQSSFNAFFAAVEKGDEHLFIDKYHYNIAPVSDDQPFFFRYYKWRDIFSGYWGKGGSFVDSAPVGLIILSFSLLQALFFSVILIIVPLFFMSGTNRQYSPLLQITYFSMIGIGFMFIEISVIQQFVLFLGNPSDAIAITIMILLLFTGIGALLSKRMLIALGEKKLYMVLMIVMPLAILGYAWGLPKVTHYFLDTTFAVRVLISFIMLAPLGILLGQFFPTGLTLVGEKDDSFVPWAYAINSVAGVVSSILAIILAMASGFTFVLITASFCYFAAAVAFHLFSQRHA